eukprot:CAMPEP_0198285334 /NCGR_PEP_ID=MMETSP1449-20131203/4663_1 /TAXON_ID=420275 /ORGANISM="Attheya septentrionalis, Strain CCMP2084" /LENGTH=768 /DNA_ID=CAMNT_0043982739 /DNA_START=78 /DNA_END=2380 /DNA_ORIENTATION=+
MDVSLVAAVGSFVVSERVLRPKATLLIILGGVLAYDLSTKTQDAASLRIYRGPALVACTLMCCAYSLRTWRRNGVACDELLFLPGSALAQKHAQQQESGRPRKKKSSAKKRDFGLGKSAAKRLAALGRKSPQGRASEGDAAAGIGSNGPQSNWIVPLGNPTSSTPESEMVAMLNSSRDALDPQTSGESSYDLEVSLGSSQDLSQGSRSRSSSPDLGTEYELRRGSLKESASLKNCWKGRSDESDENDNYESAQETQSLQLRHSSHIEGSVTPQRAKTYEVSEEHETTADIEDNSIHSGAQGRFWRPHRPQISRLGNFFFFRSTSTVSNENEYAPSGPAVFGAALDLLMPCLFNFHLFIEAINHPSMSGSEDGARILPLLFMSILIFRSQIPPKRRRRFWATMKAVMVAPFRFVDFRDAFVGDIITSVVRPIQDILYGLSYLGAVIWGAVYAGYGIAEAGNLLERSWLLHNVILPSSAILPLWWRFLQTLRQSYDSGQRWPHLGNAFKYLTASLVIVYGMAHPEDRRSRWWIICFMLATLFQIWWDTVMDWDLLVITPKSQLTVQPTSAAGSGRCACISHAARLVFTPVGRYFVQPLKALLLKFNINVPDYDQINLRPNRLYKTDNYYWRIFVINAVFRFTWMLSFIPAYHLSGASNAVVQTFSYDLKSYVGVIISCTELVRRCLWGVLTVENETITVKNEIYSSAESTGIDCSELDAPGTTKDIGQFMPMWLDTQKKQKEKAAVLKHQQCLMCSEEVLNLFFLFELSL